MTNQSDERLFKDVDACVEALAEYLPTLSVGYSPLAVTIALALHTNAGLKIAVRSGACTKEKADLVIRQLEELDLDVDTFGKSG